MLNRRAGYCFTLIEIMVALSILCLLAAGVGWHVSRMMSHHRFESEVADLCLALQEAQFLCVIHQTECELLIYPDEGALAYRLKTDEPLAVLDQKPKRLKESRFLTLDNAKSQRVAFHVLSSGRIEPTAILGLHQNDPIATEPSGLWLDLQTPIQIKLRHEKPQKTQRGSHAIDDNRL